MVKIQGAAYFFTNSLKLLCWSYVLKRKAADDQWEAVFPDDDVQLSGTALDQSSRLFPGDPGKGERCHFKNICPYPRQLQACHQAVSGAALKSDEEDAALRPGGGQALPAVIKVFQGDGKFSLSFTLDGFRKNSIGDARDGKEPGH